jgi:hypothetical protein
MPPTRRELLEVQRRAGSAALRPRCRPMGQTWFAVDAPSRAASPWTAAWYRVRVAWERLCRSGLALGAAFVCVKQLDHRPPRGVALLGAPAARRSAAERRRLRAQCVRQVRRLLRPSRPIEVSGRSGGGVARAQHVARGLCEILELTFVRASWGRQKHPVPLMNCGP